MSFPFRRIRHLLIDMDGVLYRGDAAIPGAREFLEWVGAVGMTLKLVTNNATLTPEQYRDKLASMGITVRADEIFTSALATALYLKQEGQAGSTTYVIGERGLREALATIDVRPAEENPQWVIVGLDRELTYAKLATAALAIRAGARFLGTNPDLSLPTELGLMPGAGSILAALAATTGVQPQIVGKPEPLMLRLAMADLGGTLDDTVMIGDRIDTDIAAAARLDMPSILVLTGVSTRAEVQSNSVQPTLTVDTLGELLATWRESRAGER